jgi:diketogulonate reductase-like aldo/keto reductase
VDEHAVRAVTGSLEHRRLGPVVGLGTWRTFGADRALARRVVDAALEAGTRVFDTSPMYGAAEESLADALRERRDSAVVAEKIWAGTSAEGEAQLEAQLRWFGRIEIEQIHNLVAWEEQLAVLEEARDAGAVDRLGVTHYSRSAFGELARALQTGHFDCVQLPLNPLERDCERELLPLAAELGIPVIVMRPLGSGSGLVERQVPQDALRELGVETWAQALLKWALSDERVDVVIPATKRPERARENAAAGAPPFLDDAQRRLVERLATG